MTDHVPDDIDEAIGRAARELVTGEVSLSLRPAVMAAIAPRDRAALGSWRLRTGLTAGAVGLTAFLVLSLHVPDVPRTETRAGLLDATWMQVPAVVGLPTGGPRTAWLPDARRRERAARSPLRQALPLLPWTIDPPHATVGQEPIVVWNISADPIRVGAIEVEPLLVSDLAVPSIDVVF